MKRRPSSLSVAVVLWLGAILISPAALASHDARDAAPDSSAAATIEYAIALPADSVRRDSLKKHEASSYKAALASLSSGHAEFDATPMPARAWGRELLKLIHVNRP